MEEAPQNMESLHCCAVFDELFAAYSDLLDDQYTKLHGVPGEWDRILLDFGNDPTHLNWNRFRPLRRSCEEDWSDWLAFLIERSETGTFARCVFKIEGFKPNDYAKPRIRQ